MSPAEMLHADLEALDAHDAETGRLVHDPNSTVADFEGRTDHRFYLIARALNAARLLLGYLERTP